MKDMLFAPSKTPAPGLQVSRMRLPKPVAETIQVVKNRLTFAINPDASPMRLFDETKVIFVRVPKNASNSILSFLHPGVQAATLPHHSAEYFRRVFPRQFATYTNFAPLRDPMDRFASAFTYYRTTSTKPEERHLMDVDLPFLKTPEDFVLWLNDQPDLSQVRILRWHHFQRQTSYVCDAAGRVIVDMMFPVEDMTQGICALAEIIGRRPEVARLNVSKPHALNGLPTERICNYYADDIRLWQMVFDAKILSSGWKPTIKMS